MYTIVPVAKPSLMHDGSVLHEAELSISLTIAFDQVH